MQYSITPLLQTVSSVIHNQNPIHGDKLGITHPQMWITFPQSGKQHEWWHVATIEVGCLPISKHFPTSQVPCHPSLLRGWSPSACMLRAWVSTQALMVRCAHLKMLAHLFPCCSLPGFTRRGDDKSSQGTRKRVRVSRFTGYLYCWRR